MLENISGLVYIENFISEKEEIDLLENINKQEWNTTLKRRTQHYGFIYDYLKGSANTKTTPLPEWSMFLIERLRGYLKVEPDQLIINEYEPGQGIYPHIDSTDSFKDGIISISLGSDIIMDFIRGDDKKELVLHRRSMLCLHGDARYKWRHGIVPRKSDNGVKRSKRISLTFRKMK